VLDTTLGAAAGSTSVVAPRRSRGLAIVAIGGVLGAAAIGAVVVLRRQPPTSWIPLVRLDRVSGADLHVATTLHFGMCLDATGHVTSIDTDLPTAVRDIVNGWVYVLPDGEPRPVCTTVDVPGVQTLFVRSRDISAPPRTNILVDGAARGKIVDVRIEGDRARMTIDIDVDIPVYADAVLTRVRGNNGDGHLKLDPGSTGTRLGPACPGYDTGAERCRELVNVVDR
jgi:hypothetical protein